MPGQLVGLGGVFGVQLGLGGHLGHGTGDLLKARRLFGGALGEGLARIGDLAGAACHLLGGGEDVADEDIEVVAGLLQRIPDRVGLVVGSGVKGEVTVGELVERRHHLFLQAVGKTVHDRGHLADFILTVEVQPGVEMAFLHFLDHVHGGRQGGGDAATDDHADADGQEEGEHRYGDDQFVADGLGRVGPLHGRFHAFGRGRVNLVQGEIPLGTELVGQRHLFLGFGDQLQCLVLLVEQLALAHGQFTEILMGGADGLGKIFLKGVEVGHPGCEGLAKLGAFFKGLQARILLNQGPLFGHDEFRLHGGVDPLVDGRPLGQHFFIGFEQFF